MGQKNGIVKLGNLPGKDLVAINDTGQVLIKSIVENENGKSIRHPILWENGKITRLRGLEGDLGIESEESYGFALNKNGEVVGQSVAYLSYKNDICKQTHATIWTNGKAIDLHKKIPKTNSSSATGINDFGDVLIGRYLICNDDQTILFNHNDLKTTNTNYLYKNMYVMDKRRHNNHWLFCL
ncbi:MAG: hypothetical protein HWD61_15180 [Parachlamydiaceae bacterium]|nr:MAG: hypothetical protein HWD61_15180 [Parachlamydiaceae bacterium]